MAHAQRPLELVLVDVSASRDALKAEFAAVRLPNETIALAASRGEVWLLCHVALRSVLQRWVGNEAGAAPFEIEPGGRPRLANSNVEFSLSHSGDFALIAVTRDQAIGVDFEAPRRMTMSEERRQRLLDAARQLHIAGPETVAATDLSDANTMKAWVALEAVAKADGSGIGRVLSAVGVIGGSASVSDEAAAAAISNTVRVLTPRDGLPDECVGAVAAADLPSNVALLTWTPNLAATPVDRVEA